MFSMKQKVCVAICTPMVVWDRDGRSVYEPISPLWHRARSAMATGTNINVCELFADGLEVGDARSQIAALVLSQDPRPELLFFIDSDVLVPIDALTKLLFRASCFPNYDVYAGVYCLKNAKMPEPLIYGEPGQGPLWNWAVGDLLTTESHGVRATHMGLTLIRTSLFQKMKDEGVVNGDGTDQGDEPFFKTINGERHIEDGKCLLQMGTEDIYFYEKARRCKDGCKIMVDTSVLAGHHDHKTGVTYGLPWTHGPVTKARWMELGDGSKDRKDAEAEGLKLAVDLGSGSARRHWNGYATYTTDYRPGVGVDYVQDTRMLNFPDNHWDLVASRHHLEHLPRYEQERVWQEMFRVTKPGGNCEHIVPSLDWAAWKIKEGEVDGFVYDVLYGGQEAYGVNGLHWNSHYFGYTKEVAKSLAEQAGWTEVMVTDWRDDEAIGYEMTIRAKKPKAPTKDDEPTETPVVQNRIAEHSEHATTDSRDNGHVNGVNGKQQHKMKPKRKKATK